MKRLPTDPRSRLILTAGQAAAICNVSARTVCKWFDSGRLLGYRIPGSRDRRIPRDSLLAFMKSHDMPLNGLADTTPEPEPEAIPDYKPEKATDWAAVIAAVMLTDPRSDEGRTLRVETVRQAAREAGVPDMWMESHLPVEDSLPFRELYHRAKVLGNA